jgi:hypothetical protein
MKLSEVRPFVDKLVADLYVGRLEDCGLCPDEYSAETRRALAEAFMAGVRSQGLRYQKDSALWAACGCEPTEAPTQAKEGKT